MNKKHPSADKLGAALVAIIQTTAFREWATARNWPVSRLFEPLDAEGVKAVRMLAERWLNSES